MNQYVSKRIKNSVVTRKTPKNHSAWLYIAIICSSVIAYGFIAATRYHVQAVETGYRSEELKRRRDKLEVFQHKLMLELERRRAPRKLEERAQQQGFALPTIPQTVGVREVDTVND
jgi:hypothetical protein